MASRKQPRRVQAIGYARVSTAEQAEDGHGLDAQTGIVTDRITARGWHLAAVRTDGGISGTVPADDRPALSEALALLDGGKADVLVVPRLDRLTRSLADMVNLLDRAKRHGWAVVVCDGMSGLDMTTTEGRIMATLLGAFAELERDLISRRTKEGMAAARAKGVHVGRPRTIPASVVARIVVERDAGATLQAIADALNADGVPTAQGGTWQTSTISYTYRSATTGTPKRGVRRAERAAFLQDAGVFG